MTARKKAQGKLRKANQTPKYGSIHCRHLDISKEWLPDDLAACGNLFSSFEPKFKDLLNNGTDLSNEIYEQYHLFNADQKRLFRELILAHATEICRRKANRLDLTQQRRIPEAVGFVLLLIVIEIRDEHSGAFDQYDILLKIRSSFDDILVCPREIIRFFHRRNSCDCLKEIYYKLKDQTQRTTACFTCHKIKNIREMIQCGDCKLQWCSRECQVALKWHDEDCKRYRYRKQVYKGGRKAPKAAIEPERATTLRMVVLVVAIMLHLSLLVAITLSDLPIQEFEYLELLESDIDIGTNRDGIIEDDYAFLEAEEDWALYQAYGVEEIHEFCDIVEMKGFYFEGDCHQILYREFLESDLDIDTIIEDYFAYVEATCKDDLIEIDFDGEGGCY